MKKVFLEMLKNFTGKHQCQNLCFNKLADSDIGVFMRILQNF